MVALGLYPKPSLSTDRLVAALLCILLWSSLVLSDETHLVQELGRLPAAPKLVFFTADSQIVVRVKHSWEIMVHGDDGWFHPKDPSGQPLNAKHLAQHPTEKNVFFFVNDRCFGYSLDGAKTWWPYNLDGVAPTELGTDWVTVPNGRSDLALVNLNKGVFVLYIDPERQIRPIEGVQHVHTFDYVEGTPFCYFGEGSASEVEVHCLDNGGIDLNPDVTHSPLEALSHKTVGRDGQPFSNIKSVTRSGNAYVVVEGAKDGARVWGSDDFLQWENLNTDLVIEAGAEVKPVPGPGNTVRMVIDHSGDSAGALYVSDLDGNGLSKTLERIVINDGVASILAAQHSPGTIIANTLGPRGNVLTQISHDGGHNWEQSNVHIHASPLDNGRELSSAPYILTSIGNTGKGLKHVDHGFFMLSTDQGDTWTKQTEFSALYAIAGGSIVVAMKQGRAHELLYSLNQGQEWTELKLDRRVNAHSLHCDSVGALCVIGHDGHQVSLADFSSLLDTSDKLADSKLPLQVEADSRKVTVRAQDFQGPLENYLYLRTDVTELADETVLAWTGTGELWISHDQGNEWARSDVTDVINVFANPHSQNRVFAVSQGSVLHVSADRGKTFKKITPPRSPKPFGRILDFHHTDPDWLLLHTVDECGGPIELCPTSVYYSLNFGKSWKLLLQDAPRCLWVGGLLKPTHKELILCEQQEGQRGPSVPHVNLVASTDFFRSKPELLVEETFGVALEPYFLVVASMNEDGELSAQVSTDGTHFVSAKFPKGLKTSKTSGFTVIDAHTRSVFLHATTNGLHGHEFGAILKSDDNGTFYALSLDNVNRNERGFVDYEKVKSLEGVSVANTIANPDDVWKGGRKNIKTMITHSDGAFWGLIPPPEGLCESRSLQKCSLHLHGYTERIDIRNAPSSPSAVGLMIAQGNVGEYLSSIRDSSTFISRDAGITWKKFADEPMIWEYGDSGSIIVAVAQERPTNTILYTLDEGATWTEREFSTEMVTVKNVASIPSDTSRKFIIFVEPELDKGSISRALQLDFSEINTRQCVFDGRDAANDDFELWVPEHPQTKSKCLFGRETEYYRKIPSKECYVGKTAKELGKPHKYIKICQCTEQDFECDTGFERDPEGRCKLSGDNKVPGQKEQCENDAIFWRQISGYRKISLDGCEGGIDLAKGVKNAPCPGKEKEFKERFGDGGDVGGSGVGSFLATFFFLVFLFTAIGVIGVFIFTRVQQGGRIQLGEFEGDGATGGANGIIRAGMSAVALAALQVGRVWDFVLGKLDSRMRSGQMGLYSHIDDEERSRILDSDLEDDELDNPELGDPLSEYDEDAL